MHRLRQLNLLLVLLYFFSYIVILNTWSTDVDYQLHINSTSQCTKEDTSSGNFVWNPSRPVIYSDVRNELKPKIRLDLNYHMYYERVSRMLNTMGKQVANCYSSGFKHCISYNATEGVYATNPYDERDLVLSISPSVPILINPEINNSDDIMIVIGMVTSPTQYIDRISIRQTWCNTTQLGISFLRCIFFTGMSPTASTKQQQFLREEASLFNDIVQFDIVDTYLNLTAIQLQAYNWTLQHFPMLDYYMRVDTDMHVNIPFLLLHILSVKREKFIYGRTFVNAHPYRDPRHKNYLPEWVYPDDTFPPYQSGCLCIWSRDVLQTVVTGSSIVRPVHYVDDVYYGQIFKYFNLTLTNDERFIKYSQIPFSPYLGYQVAAAHRYSPVDLVALSILFPHYLVCLT